MSSGARKTALLFLFMSSFCLVFSYGQAQPPALPAASPAVPAPPPGLEQAPPRAPIVAYQNGQLTILADNASLSSILRLVGERTGARLDVPAGAEERVFGRWGPGPVREVLAALLNGSRFNYVMLGSAADPNGLAQIILSAKPAEANSAPVQQAAAFTPEPAEAEIQPQSQQPGGDGVAAEERVRQQRSLLLLQNLEQRQRTQLPRD